MREEYNNVLSTPTEVDKISRFGRYQYIGETQISAQYIDLADISVYLYKKDTRTTARTQCKSWKFCSVNADHTRTLQNLTTDQPMPDSSYQAILKPRYTPVNITAALATISVVYESECHVLGSLVGTQQHGKLL